MTLREYVVQQVIKSDMWLLYGDVGHGVVKQSYRKSINCGIAECSMVGMAAGMASCGEKVACYAIAPHYIRALEHIRLLVKPEYGVKLIGVGEGQDYAALGKSHTVSELEMESLCDAVGLRYCCVRTKEMADYALNSSHSFYIHVPNVQL